MASNVRAWRRRPDPVQEIAYGNPLPLYMPPTTGLRGRRPGGLAYGEAGGLCATARVVRRSRPSEAVLQPADRGVGVRMERNLVCKMLSARGTLRQQP